jgi:hypothetical protein
MADPLSSPMPFSAFFQGRRKAPMQRATRKRKRPLGPTLHVVSLEKDHLGGWAPPHARHAAESKLLHAAHYFFFIPSAKAKPSHA